jgi:hypothetical protein
MSLSKITEFQGVDGIPYFDAHNVKHGGAENKVLAYLIRTRGGTDVYKSGYISFHLKDSRNNIVRAMMFNILDYEKKGYTLVSMKKTPVLVQFTTSAFKRDLTLIISDITPWRGHFDYDLFVGRYPNVAELADQTKQLIGATGFNVNINPTYLNDSYASVCNGQAGGYVKFMHMVVTNLMLYIGTPGVNGSDLMRCALITLSVYSKYLTILETVEVPLKHQLIELTYNGAASIQEEGLKNVCVDAITSSVGLGAPDHLYAHLISSIIEQTQRLLGYSYEFPLLLEGSTKRVDGGSLSKY